MAGIKSLLPEEVIIELPEDYENDEEKPFLLNFLEENDFLSSNKNHSILASKLTSLTTTASNDILDQNNDD